jgi:hypothetical protein
MISREQLEIWAKLYDLGHQSLEENVATRQARAELNMQLEQEYARLIQGGSIPFRDFRREAIRHIRAFLIKER